MIGVVEIGTMLAIGGVAGIASGMFGIGGGILIVPALVFFAAMPQHQAVATSLVALLLPVGILAAMSYYKAGVIAAPQIKMGLLVALGLFIGAYFGSKLALKMESRDLQRLFALLLFAIALKLWFKE